MDHAKTFQSFFDSIRMESEDDYLDGLSGVTKKLNQYYYSSNSDSEHRILVGSIGRKTAVDGTSDVDLLFVLPRSVYEKFDDYDSNGQSALLQEVKKVLLDRYPNSDIKGDGQAVVIDFTNRTYKIDLVPAFARNDGAFDFPNSNDGGSWKKTDPIPEQEASCTANDKSNGNFIRLCNCLRVWSANVGCKFGGLLIDTLVEKRIDQSLFRDAEIEKYCETITNLFSELKNEDPDQSYWFALGSHQQVNNTGNGEFVRKAESAYELLNDAEGEAEIEDALSQLFGKRFDDCLVDGKAKTEELRWSKEYAVASGEQFIEDLFPVQISETLHIECEITQNGWRPSSLREILKKKTFLRKDKQLRFYVERTSTSEPYLVFWKTKNVGEWAYARECIRGQIVKDSGCREQIEHTDFDGNHYVECYIIKQGVCVARNRIEVPIRINS